MTTVGDAALWSAIAQGWRVPREAAQALAERTASAARAGVSLRPDYLALAAALLQWIAARRQPDRTFLVGLAGAQGTGKSTLANHLAAVATTSGIRLAVLGIDDLYLPQAERVALAAREHPLLRTRGAPGTHDVALAERCLTALGNRAASTVSLPAFDKGLDDRLPSDAWRTVETPLDVVVFEGWCVGLGPQTQPELATPCNALEAIEDADGRWRSYVDARLAGDYAALFARLDGLLALLPPDFATVLRWRTEQEQVLPAERRMDAAALTRFVAHYERLTRHGIATWPARADLLVRLAADHRPAELSARR